MPNQTILEQVRTPLATALSSVAGNVYSFVPETVIPPAVVVVPDSPYLEFETISKSNIRAKVNMTITVAVAYNSNPASLDNIEQLVISVLAVIPAGYIVSSVERPTVTQVGASTYVGNAAVQSAVYTVSVEVFQARLAGGGQIEGVDFTATPFRMGRSLFNKCVGLLGSYMDTESMCQ